jgi:iron complex outermembrane receptor protein/outer membrane receptor for ferric coprogen and ferric-rhodotorulic acid
MGHIAAGSQHRICATRTGCGSNDKHTPAPGTQAGRTACRPTVMAAALHGALATGLLLGTAMLPGPAHAQASGTGATAPTALPPGETARTFHIPAGPLDVALDRFARVGHVNLSYDAALIAGLTTPGLSGSFSTREGLLKLLEGHGIQALAQPGGGYSLRKSAVAPAPGPSAPAGSASLPEVKVSAQADLGGTTEGTGMYTTRATGAGTRMDLSLRETPQSVSVVTRQQMDDQNLVSLDDVLRQTPGIVADRLDERVSFSSRGFELNHMIDGIPTLAFKSPAAEASMLGTAIYDRVEVVRGAAGLLSGVGSPGGSINLVRKRPTADFSGQVTVGAGSWNNYNAQVDIGGALNAQGSLRGRVVASRTSGDSFITSRRRSDDVLYGIVEASLSPSTVVAAGYEYQKTAIDGSNFGQSPLFFSDGTRTQLPRSFNSNTPWSNWDMESRKLFIQLDHRLGNGWRVKMEASDLRNERQSTFGYLFNYLPIDRQTGAATIELRDNPVKSHSKSFDVFAKGPFEAFGQIHEAVVGLSRNDYDYTVRINSANPAGWDRRPVNLHTLQDYPKPAQFNPLWVQPGDATQTGLYGATRLKLADPLSVIAGARATWYREDSSFLTVPTATRTNAPTASAHGVVTPYAGMVLDLSQEFSAYASYTRIFQPNAERDRSNNTLAPQRGTNYEVGIKGEHAGGLLNTGIAVFRTRQDNLAVEDPGGGALPDGSTPYRAVKGARSQGFELTASGQLARGWQVMGGYTYYAQRDADGMLLQPSYPRRLFRVATSYRLPGDWSRLTVGGSISYQGRIFYDELSDLGRVTQGGLTVLGLMARYEFSKQLSASLHVENLTDKHYYSGLGGYNGYVYANPRNAWLKLSYRY